MGKETNLVTQGSTDIAVRSKKMAASLSSYARQLTFENRSRRNLYRLAGMSPMLRDKIFFYLFWASFIFYFLIPFSLGVLYYGLIASPQYESEVRFVLRSAAPILSRDRFSASSAEPKAKIAQDTQVVTSYLDSYAFIADLEKTHDWTALYRKDGIDFLSQLDPESSKEARLDYWRQYYSSWINPKSGIVELTLRAFSAADAHNLMKTILVLAEQRVNQLNAGIWSNLQASAEADLKRASDDLEHLRLSFRDLQNKTGVFDVTLSAESLSALIARIDGEISDLKSQRAVLEGTIVQTSPVLRTLDQQISARQNQVDALKARTAGNGGLDNDTLAQTSQEFEAVQLELKIAETRFSDAIEELEKVKLISSLQLIYLDQFTSPTLADSSTYPNRPLSIAAVFVVCLVLWSAASGFLWFLRHRID